MALVAMCTAEQNILNRPVYSTLQDSVKEILYSLNKQIDLIHEAIEKLIGQSEIMTMKLKIMTIMKGVGKT